MEEKRCNNCHWYGKGITEYPCSHCEVCDHTKWEPNVEKVDYKSFYPVTTGLSSPIYDDIKKRISTQLASEQMWGIAAPINLLSDIPDNNSVITFKNGTSINCDGFKGGKKFMKKQQNQKRRNRNQIRCNGNYCRDISEIMFNGPATVIKWSPSVEQWAYNKKGDKTVAVCGENDKFDKTTGFLLAIIKEFFDKQSYDNILRKIDGFEEEAETLTVYDIVDMLPKEERLKLYYELGKAIRENEIDIHQKKRPKNRYNLNDQVTCIKSKKHVVYEIDNYRWNPDDKIWMYRCVTENGYTRWYPESSLMRTTI